MLVKNVIPGATITDIYGQCPVQGDGEINGLPFYFRARHQHWSLHLALSSTIEPGDVYPDGQEGYIYTEEYTHHGEHGAGYMDPDEAMGCIARAAQCLQSIFAYQQTHDTHIGDISTAFAALSDYNYALEYYARSRNHLVTLSFKLENLPFHAELDIIRLDMATALTHAWQALQCHKPYVVVVRQMK